MDNVRQERQKVKDAEQAKADKLKKAEKAKHDKWVENKRRRNTVSIIGGTGGLKSVASNKDRRKTTTVNKAPPARQRPGLFSWNSGKPTRKEWKSPFSKTKPARMGNNMKPAMQRDPNAKRERNMQREFNAKRERNIQLWVAATKGEAAQSRPPGVPKVPSLTWRPSGDTAKQKRKSSAVKNAKARRSSRLKQALE